LTRMIPLENATIKWVTQICKERELSNRQDYAGNVFEARFDISQTTQMMELVYMRKRMKDIG